MEYKYINNPYIYNFLQRFNENEWDDIIEDLIMNSINKINEIEKEEELKKEKEKEEILKQKKFRGRASEIVTFKNCKCPPLECGINMINKTAELKLDPYSKICNLKRLEKLNQNINNNQLEYNNVKNKK